MIRSKPTVAATQWSDPLVLVNPNSPDIVCPKYNAKPLIAERKPWPKLVAHIAPKLLKFYSGDSRYQIVDIPPSVRVEMCCFLRGHAGGSAGSPPLWPAWCAPTVSDEEDEDDDEVEVRLSMDLHDDPTDGEYIPFGSGVLTPVRNNNTSSRDPSDHTDDGSTTDLESSDTDSESTTTDDDQTTNPPFAIGDRVMVKWKMVGREKDKWFQATVLGIAYQSKTAHLKYDDKHEDKSAAWDTVHLL